mmetsp:Transcript_30930/g.52080  ORF Transcript_30930/g.52080 Transcript_30930/m.52080 type:complete len:99 (-) Transcript_30930:95-391(-)
MASQQKVASSVDFEICSHILSYHLLSSSSSSIAYSTPIISLWSDIPSFSLPLLSVSSHLSLPQQPLPLNFIFHHLLFNTHSFPTASADKGRMILVDRT